MTKKNITLALILLVLFFSFSNFIILGKNCHPLGYNYRVHLINSISIAKGFNLGMFLTNPLGVYNNIIIHDKDYPPLYYVIAAAIFHLLGVNFMFMTSTLFLILLILCTYKIGKIVKDRTAGLLSAVIVSFYPIIYLSSRNFDLELAQSAMVCASLYLLMRSGSFNNKNYSLFFGIVFAIAMLVKQQAVIFIIGPLFVNLFYAFKNLRSSRDQLMNIFIALFMFSMVSFYFFYYIYLDPGDLGYIFVRSKIPGEIMAGPANWLDAKQLLFYFQSLRKYQIGIFNLSMFLLLIPVVYFKKKNIKYASLLAAWFVVPLILLTFIPFKCSEYTISYLPVLAIVTSLGVLSFRRLVVKAGLISTILVLNIFLFYSYISPKYQQSDLSKTFLNNFLVRINVSYTILSGNFDHNRSILKTENSNYKAVNFLKAVLPNKKSKVGVVAYLASPRSTLSTDIELILSLYTSYDIKNLILDPTAGELGAFDAMIFASCRSGNSEKWLNKSNFIQQIADFNKQQYAVLDSQRLKGKEQFLVRCFLFNDISLMPCHGNYFPISEMQLEKVVNYYPKLKMIQKIDGFSQCGDIFIYQKL